MPYFNINIECKFSVFNMISLWIFTLSFLSMIMFDFSRIRLMCFSGMSKIVLVLCDGNMYSFH